MVDYAALSTVVVPDKRATASADPGPPRERNALIATPRFSLEKNGR